MNWSEQFVILHKILLKKLAEEGRPVNFSEAARYLGIPLSKYKAWKKGQAPVVDDMQMLAQIHSFNAAWLLLGIGEPVQVPLHKTFNPNLVEICDTLRDLVASLPDSLPEVAQIGGITTQDLQDCMNVKRLPDASTIQKWVLHYRINANFLIAQIGKPFLTEDEFLARSVTSTIQNLRMRRGDFTPTIQNEERNEKVEDLQEQVMDLQKELLNAQKEIIRLQQELMDRGKVGSSPMNHTVRMVE